MCVALDISQRTYYKYRNSEDKDYYDYLIIKEIFDESNAAHIFINLYLFIYKLINVTFSLVVPL